MDVCNILLILRQSAKTVTYCISEKLSFACFLYVEVVLCELDATFQTSTSAQRTPVCVRMDGAWTPKDTTDAFATLGTTFPPTEPNVLVRSIFIQIFRIMLLTSATCGSRGAWIKSCVNARHSAFAML